MHMCVKIHCPLAATSQRLMRAADSRAAVQDSMIGGALVGEIFLLYFDH
jgi:hypothetical protein